MKQVVLAILLLSTPLSAQTTVAPEPWKTDWPQGRVPKWVFLMGDGGVLWVQEDEVKREGTKWAVWMHLQYPTVTLTRAYTKLVSRIVLNCRGQFIYTAQTEYSADGTLLRSEDR